MKRRFIAFVLVVLILIPLIPNPVSSKGFVKEIDVIYNDFKLQVEGKNVSSKEPFVYDGDLWVPMKDLGKVLGITVDFNSKNRTLIINSQGKLNINDSSNAKVAYQRGYEIEAKERIIANLDKEIQAFEGKSTSNSSATKSIVKNISVGFSNIDFFLDGKKIQLDREPLIYGEDVYVSLVALSPVLYITPSLDGNRVSIDSNAVLVKKDGYTSVDDLAKFRDSLNNRLGTQLAEMEKRKKVLMDVKIPYEEIKTLTAMEKYLNKHLDEISDLPVDVSLKSGTGNWYYVDIDFSTRYNNRWRKLSRRDVEAYVWDIFVAITTLYDEDAQIQGNIKKYVSFDTKLKDITFSFINSRLDMTTKVDPVFIEELLKKSLGRYNREYFDYSARISGYDLELTITPSSSDYMRKWSSESKIRFLREINYEIRRYYPGLKINGRIEYPGEETIHFLLDDGKLSSPNIIDEIVEYLNDRYDVFRTGSLRIPMKYGLHQVDLNNYKLVIDMDFDSNDSNWNQSAEEALGSFLQDVIKEIISLWDINIFAQAFDKNQSLVSEFVISQDTVQAVTASPISGNIEEGKTVKLYTNTSGADIYYTIDDSIPSTNNRIHYTGPIVINKDTTIKAYATKTGFKDSPIYEFKYTIVAAGNIAEGLDDLRIDSGRLEPNFNKGEYNYRVNLPHSTSVIGITPTASKGTITIDGVNINSGETKDISLKSDETKVTVTHKEDGKIDRVYTVIISIGDEGSSNSDVKLGQHTFSTSIVGVFKGKLTSTSTTNFSGYTIELLSKTGSSYGGPKVVANDGSFQITGFSIEFWDKIVGYKYEVKDSKGTVVDEGNL